MTLSSETNKYLYSGGGVVDDFVVSDLFLDDSHLVVNLVVVETNTATLQVITTDYTVTGELDPGGGTVTMVTPPAVGERLSIVRTVPLTQLLDYVANDAFPAEQHERALDKLTMIAQQIKETLGRAVLQPVWTTDPPPDIADFKSTENIFVAQITGTVDGGGDYPWNQVEPVAGSATWQDRAGGLDSGTEGNATPFAACSSIATNTIVLMVVTKDADQNNEYRFLLPGTCP